MGSERVTVRLRRPRFGGGLRVLVVAVAFVASEQVVAAEPAAAAATTVRAAAARSAGVKPKAAPVLIDINAADRATLKTLPGVGDAEAAKIAAGRPYLTKADLVTKSVLPVAAYLALKKNIVAGRDPSWPRRARADR